MMPTLECKVHAYKEWRDSLSQTILKYRDWLAKNLQADALQELRLFDILAMLERDQLVVAFLAEFSRGKTETINALFFADFNLRLLPSEAGRTTMCPTEIFWDGNEQPCIKLLPIETRVTDDTLTYLKSTPDAWQKFKLNLDSPADMQATLHQLADQKFVTQQTAETLGLFNAQDISMMNSLKKTGQIEVPVWRHALINYPHPLLKSGLVVLDTPGLNSLGAEPELTLNVISHAHASLFLTATDSGVTQSDMKIWNTYVKGRAQYKLVLLNKIDILWDALKSKQAVANEIEKQINMTAHQLNIAPDTIFAISAQKALLAKIKKDDVLLNQSGILALEARLGDEMIQAKHAILGRTIASECSQMMKVSRKIIQQRLSNLREQVDELRELRGQNQDASKHLLAHVVTDRKRYESSIPTFNLANEQIVQIGKKLSSHLSAAYLDKILASSRQEMGERWTTVGLNKSMRKLTKHANDLAARILKESGEIKHLAADIYHVFQSKHGFEVFDPPPLDMSSFVREMHALEKITNDFCVDPVNLLTEKHFLMRKFFLGLGTQTRTIFAQAEKDCECWGQAVLSALKNQMAEHKANLEQRSKNLTEAKANAAALESRLANLESEYKQISAQGAALDSLLLQLVRTIKPAINH